jgi:hypothetical protein
MDFNGLQWVDFALVKDNNVTILVPLTGGGGDARGGAQSGEAADAGWSGGWMQHAHDHAHDAAQAMRLHPDAQSLVSSSAVCAHPPDDETTRLWCSMRPRAYGAR